jgi:TonB family protein
MRFLATFIAILLLVSNGSSQSGRRAKEIRVPVTVPDEQATEPKAVPSPADESARVTAEKNRDYRCTDDGTLALIVDDDSVDANIFSGKEVDKRVEITAKPKPGYTKEARRNGVQGFVVLRVLLAGSGKVSRIRIVKGLPSGLTENAIRAACKMEFKPAMKDGKFVGQWLIAEYIFRLADSSIFAP